MNRIAEPIPAVAPAHFHGRALGAVLFDLDGTLLDTAGDIALALNRAIGELGWTPLGLEDVRRFIGAGGAILVERAALLRGRELSSAQHSAIVQRFFHHYGQLGERGEYTAEPYPGAADALLRQRGLIDWVDCVVGGDTCERRKPDPQPLLFACESLGVEPQAALMVGDSVHDAQGRHGHNLRHLWLQ
jgi:phosphoglycolate phosphatase